MEMTIKRVFTQEEEKILKQMMKPIDTNMLSERAISVLNNHNYKIVGSLCRRSKRAYLGCMRGCGKKTFEEIESYLATMGLTIGMDLPEMVDDAIFFHERGNIYQRRQVK